MPTSPKSSQLLSKFCTKDLLFLQKEMIQRYASRQVEEIFSVNYRGKSAYQLSHEDSNIFGKSPEFPVSGAFGSSDMLDPWTRVKPPPSAVRTSSSVPLKSCLKLKSTEKEAKAVSFADNHGFALSSIRRVYEMTEEPPISQVINEICSSLHGDLSFQSSDLSIKDNEERMLLPDFEQPSSDFIKFKQQVEKNYVCLENVIIKDKTNVAGIITVKNLSFEKIVFVRVTFDQWKSFNDIYASYVKTFPGDSSLEHDTFQFSINLPMNFDYFTQRVEFCVCYQACGNEYWDNNHGNNYVVKSNVFRQPSKSVVRELSLPSTYCELPSPQFNTWVDWEKSGPFY